jgi:hypothetical protein
MPWITRDGRPQFVGDWGGLSDGERWQAIYNRNAAIEQESGNWTEDQVTSYQSSELTKRLRLDNYGYFALRRHSGSNFSMNIESKDLQIVYALKLSKTHASAIIDEIEQEIVGPKQKLYPKGIRMKLEEDRGGYLLNIELESVLALLPFQNMNDLVYFQNELKRISSWTRDNSSLVPQKLLDYLNQNTDNGISDEIVTFVKNEYPKEKLAFASEYEFPTMITGFWTKKGFASGEFHRYPEVVRKRIDSADALAKQEMIKVVFLCKLELFESLISDGVKYAEEIERSSLRLKDVDAFLAKKELRLNTRLKSLLFAVVNNRLFAVQ